MPARKKKPVEPEKQPVTEPVKLSSFTPSPSVPQEDTITFKRSHFYSAVTALAFAAGVLLGYFLWGVNSPGRGSQFASQSSGALAEAPPTQDLTRYNIPTENAYAIGPADAPITVVEFSDYQCPFCRRWHNEVYEPLLASYPGKIRLVYRHFPLTQIHPDALSAAEAAMCAGEQDAYWPFHEKLFGSDSLGNSMYLQYAQDLKLNMSTFESCLTNHKYQEVIAADSDSALALDIRATPTFFINGLRVVGAQPLDVFKQIIDKELAREISN